MADYKICSRCVMDTSDPDIDFDQEGMCNHCRDALGRVARPPLSLGDDAKKAALDAIVARIRADSHGGRYDCVIGLSGGVDSSYVAYLVAKVYGLKPLAVHLDNGWNAELAVKNIENICSRLGIDLMTKVVNWEEFKDLQLSFLRAGTPDAEVPSDHAIVTSLYDAAFKHGVKWVITGVNHASESILPKAWASGHDDWVYIKSVWKLFGTMRPKTYPRRGFLNDALYRASIRSFAILDYVDYDKEAAKRVVGDQLGWRDYGRKHGESLYTKILQEYILPRKFGFDKRRAHLSSLVVAGQLKREEALASLRQPLYPDAAAERQDIEYLLAKFGISQEEFSKIMGSTPKKISDYPNSQASWYRKLGYAAYRKLFKK